MPKMAYTLLLQKFEAGFISSTHNKKIIDDVLSKAEKSLSELHEIQSTVTGNALVDTQFKVTHKLIDELGLVIDQMNLSSADEQAPIIERLRRKC